MNLARLVSGTAARSPGKTAVVFEGNPVTYGGFDREVGRYAAMLHAAGIRKGDRIAVQLPKQLEFLFLHFAALSIGAVTLPLNAEYQPEEVEYFLSDSGSSLFATDGERFARSEGAIRELRGVRTLLVDGAGREGADSLPDLLSAAPAAFRRDWPAGGDDPAMICYTSGTTGRS
ncbi:MAG TPA: AMP-binding protein, partial [Candidatus Deferrimicrobiaceae bacterium]